MKIVKGIATTFVALLVSFAAFADGSPEETRAAFLQLLDRPRVPLKPELHTMLTLDGTKRVHVWFSTEENQRVPGYLVMPDAKTFKGRRPVIIALHGTGGVKEGGAIEEIVTKAAQAGFIGVAIDGRYHGERTDAGGGAMSYNAAIARAFETGGEHPFYYDTVWDVMRLIDYLTTRKDVDASRIGLTGISKGGIETYLTAAADPRVAAAVSYLGVQRFKWALDNGQWRARILTIEDGFAAAAKEAKKDARDVDFVREFYARLVPGIDGQFDAPAMLGLIAPRPLMVVNSDSDANTPIAGVRVAVRSAEAAYAAANAKDKLEFIVQADTPHRVNPENIDAGIAWFVKWLNPQ
jgi:dienelactone hydrolase